jgi:hypothetical protein
MPAHRTLRPLLSLIIGCILAAGCSSTRCIKVAVPPRVDLRGYPTVGLVTFSSNENAELERMSTQRFLQEVQAAQPGTRVIELGPEQEVLASLHRQSWDAQTLQALKQARGLDVVVIGQLDVRKTAPKVQFSTSSIFNAVNVRADVNASLSARLLETASAATMWTDSSQLTTTLANVSASNRGGSIGVRDAEAVYGEMVDRLVCDITDAFRTHYVTRRVPKEQVQTASAGE